MSIEISSLTKNYGTQVAIDNLSLKINKGEIVGLLGPNGAGKSTLIKILTTYLPACQGQISIEGYNLNSETKKIQSLIGYLPEHNPLELELYPKEYLKFVGNFYNVPKSRIDEVIQLTGLTKVLNKKIHKLSKGYRQRVGLAAAIINDPEILILDEPTTGLDPNQLEDIRKLIRTLGERKTVLLSTHILQEAKAICNRILVLNEGKLVAEHTQSTSNTIVLTVKFNKEVPSELWKDFTLLKSYTCIEACSYSLTFEKDKNEEYGSHIFDFAVTHGLKITRMQEENINLESFFKASTTLK